MGYIAHHAIIVTSGFEADAIRAHKKAKSIGLLVTEVVEQKLNGYYSFLICPDGSKEGWPESKFGERWREEWITWANSRRGKVFIDWALVRYGGDEPYLAKVQAKNT